MLQKLVNFIAAAILFPFALLFYMNKWLYEYTIAYAMGTIKMLRGTR